MTLGEWEQKLRTDSQYGYRYTQSARDEADRVGDIILKAFGKVR
jgi:hypothetical protein